MRTQVAIIGGGPSGLLLSQLLHKHGVESVIIERRTREHVLSRVRAGVLEQGLASLMRQAGVGERMDRQGFIHNGTHIAFDESMFRVDFAEHIDKSVLIYGQTELTRDLYDAREAAGGTLIFNAENVVIEDAKTDFPYVTCTSEGVDHRIDCDFVAGCDGFHGVSRKTIPESVRTEYEKIYPFGWLGVLSETQPVSDELIYSNSSRGFALCSMRNEQLSRYYIQCPASDRPEDWSDNLFWDELRYRIPNAVADQLQTGPTIEKSIAPLRSFVCEPMRWGSLFLCGDAAHIVPPTGAKGLNTAASDVHYLFNALRQFYEENDSEGIDRYSERALSRVWKAERFSWWLTATTHRFPDQPGFELKMQRAELEFLQSNKFAQAAFAINYVGLPY